MMSLTFGSLFSGIGGFDLGFERAGMTCAWQCEIDTKCQYVLQKQFPLARLYNDVRTITAENTEPVDLICGGFPCQDVSVAGKRKGLAGERSGLWYEFHRILQELKPKWVVIENVPGLLSSNRGRDFAAVLSGLADIGYLSSWRVLDSQYFGVAQRRRRIFIIGCLGRGSAAKVLFDTESMSGNTPKNTEAAERVARNVEICAYEIHTNDDGRKDRPEGGLYVKETDKSLTLQTGQGKGYTVIACENNQHAHRGGNKTAPTFIGRMGTGGGNVPLVQQITGTPNASGYKKNGTQEAMNGLYFRMSAFGEYSEDGRASTLNQRDYKGATDLVVIEGVRRLTPTECGRLQGFPDDWNDWLSDSARYKQYGNAVTVNVAEWIGLRIVEANK